ncbi:MAG TPA: GAF domain-containing protein [Thermoanaerobaculia bacterium]|jgi:hypothetical protein|nr:GAF domain-containing protein [Thermoanaerobaculia bacterium]
MSLSESIHHLNREIGATVERAIADLRREISQRLRAGNEEIQRRLDELAPKLPAAFLSHADFAHAERELGLDARRGTLRDLRDGFAAIDRARSQGEILTVLLHEASRYASRAAVLLVRGGELRGWGSEGFGEAEPSIRGLVLEAQDGPWGQLIQGQGAVSLAAADCAGLCSRIESPLPREGVLVPLVLRDRVAAALYADRLDGGELDVEALQILAHGAAQAIETLPFRERAATPTLTLATEGAAGGAAPAVVMPPREPERAETPAAAPAAVSAEPEAEAEPEVEVEAEPEPAYPIAEPQAMAGTPWTEEDERFAVPVESAEVPAARESWEIPSPRYTAELPVPAGAETAAIPATQESRQSAAGMTEEVPRYPRSVEPEPTAPVPIPNLSPEATVLLERPSFQQTEPEPAAPPPQPLRPVPAPEPSAAGMEPAERPSPLVSGTPEVHPPSDVEGPGWAFATTRVPVASFGNEAQHEEARRLARLLVSEIKLYNEEQVEEGRRNRDIYERLKEDIDRSRQMYDERVDPQILRSTDYFYQELVRILAAGDSKALGI